MNNQEITEKSRFVLLKDIQLSSGWDFKRGDEFVCVETGPTLKFSKKRQDPCGNPSEVYTVDDMLNEEWFTLIPEYISGEGDNLQHIVEWYKRHNLTTYKDPIITLQYNILRVYVLKQFPYHEHNLKNRHEDTGVDKYYISDQSGNPCCVHQMPYHISLSDTGVTGHPISTIDDMLKVVDHFKNY